MHRGELSAESAEKMKAAPGLYLNGLTCKQCGAWVMGTRDLNDYPIPVRHVIAGTRKKDNSGKRTDKR
jgi:hypothetical protein